ncbi:MAG: NADH-quinone oxidoreductase subunit N [Candidatus Marinimicrobia bacterium]|jgi:NADH-quinone oxidoreductase subunit N|nr:NADH-quinone oxidoreductase subunit N [Candidatus Neomarinimicrobiota bacterium]
MSNLSSLSYYIPELIMISAILLIIILDIIPSTKSYTFNLALASIVASSFFLCQNYGESHSLFMGMITLDPFSHYFKYIFLFATCSIILISRFDRQLDRKYASEYNALLLIVLLGLFLMSSSVNLLMIYISIELVSIPSYILAGMLKNDKESNEASLKYVIFGSLASGLMLFGLSILYGITGSTDISGISSALQIIEFPLTIYFPLILILAGFGYKISMVPFHFWTPDVYEGAPTPITAFLSVAPKAAGFAILIRIFYTMFTVGGISEGAVTLDGINWPALIAVASAITMTLGNLLAIQQKDVKRLLAYSSISHVGFMLMAFVFISPEAVRAIMLYLFIYLFMNLSAFYMAIFASNKLNAHVIDDWKGMGKINPILSAFMILSLLSLTGLPPTAGFVGKVYVFAELFKHQQFYWLAVVAILNSVVSLYYYFSIAKAMYLDEVDTPVEAVEAHPVIKWSIILFSAQNLLFFIYWEPLIEFIDNSIHLFGM